MFPVALVFAWCASGDKTIYFTFEKDGDANYAKNTEGADAERHTFA